MRLKQYLNEGINKKRYLAHDGKELKAFASKKERQEWMDKNNGKVLNRHKAEVKYRAMAVLDAMFD